MKRALLTLMAGLLLAVGGYALLYRARTAEARAIQSQENSELLWLKHEFNLNDDEFSRIRKLHEGYLPKCEEMCARIARVNMELESLVLATNQVTPDISSKFAEISRLREECQKQMLAHFYAVSASMPAPEGRRYLHRMQKLTSLSNMRDHSVSEHSEHAH